MFAQTADSEGISNILDQYGSRLQKKTINMSLMAVVKGCKTASLQEAIECVDLLIQWNANINSEVEGGKTALMMACEKGYLELVTTLIDHGALVTLKDTKKRTPLMYAIGAQAQNGDVIQELINRNANVNEQTMTGTTPLLLATQKGYASIVRKLLANGADLKHQGGDQQNSALHSACAKGDISTLHAILEYCRREMAKSEQVHEFIYLKNRKGKTAFEVAEEEYGRHPDDKNREEVFRELKSFYEAKEKEVEEVQNLLIKEVDESLTSKSNSTPQQNPEKQKTKS